MDITSIDTRIDPITLAPVALVVTIGLHGRTVEQAVAALRAACTGPADTGGWHGHPGQPFDCHVPAQAPPAKGIAAKARAAEERLEAARVALAAAAAEGLGAYDGPGTPEQRVRVGETWPLTDGYPPSKIERTQNGQGPFWVVTLEDGSRLKVSKADGRELARKPSEAAEDARRRRDALYTSGQVTIAPTAAQSGPGAPIPGAEAPDVPFPTPPEQPSEVDPGLVACATVSDAIAYAVEHDLPPLPGRDSLLAWAQRVKKHVPALKVIAAQRYLDRIGRAYDQLGLEE